MWDWGSSINVVDVFQKVLVVDAICFIHVYMRAERPLELRGNWGGSTSTLINYYIDFGPLDDTWQHVGKHCLGGKCDCYLISLLLVSQVAWVGE